MSKIMIVVGHPQRTTFCAALARAYEQGAKDSGHQVTTFMLSDMKFDPILREGYRREQSFEPDLRAAYEALAGCDHLVLIFPLWCGDMPAILKGIYRAHSAAGSDCSTEHRERDELEHLSRKDRANCHDDGHAGVDLSLVVSRSCTQASQTQHPAFHRDQAGARHPLWDGRNVKTGDARALA
jgi:hypothetical protein